MADRTTASTTPGARPRRRGWRRPTALALAAALALAPAACTADDPDVDDATATSATTTSTTTTSTTTTAEGGDDGGAAAFTGARAVVEWFVAALNGADVTADEYQRATTEAFRAQAPFEDAFLPLLEQLRAAGPYTVLEPAPAAAQGEAVVADASGATLRLSAAVDPDGRIAGLLAQPGEPPQLDDPPADLAEAFARLEELGDLWAVAAEVHPDGCAPVAQASASEPAPIASVVKLYVLAALAEEIDAGEVAWDEELTIRPDLKSLPSGTLQDRPDGSTVTVEEAARLMISISDNTATDLLIDRLGREQVEAVVAAAGVAPDRNTPFPTTRELFALKLGPAEQRRAYVEADADARREILAGLDLDALAPEPQAWTEPRAIHQIEWFASPLDLCRLSIRLAELAARPGMEPMSDILSANPGIPSTTEVESLWFKGGSEPGVLSAWWRVEVDGRTIVVAGTVADPDQPVDQLRAVLLLAAARDLLADQPATG